MSTRLAPAAAATPEGRRIEDYAVIGDTQTVALVGCDGSIDWMCAPRFDSDACFAALLGGTRDGRWLLAPRGGGRRVTRRYREGTLVLETEIESDDGVVRITDCMPPRQRDVDLVRLVEALRGSVALRLELTPRFGYGAARPWIRVHGATALAIAGPDALCLRGAVPLERRGGTVGADFVLHEGTNAAFTLTWYPSHEPPPRALDARQALQETELFWRGWISSCRYAGEWGAAVERSLLTLKALTYAPTGGVIAAATTSLPEQLGGARNWDYRFCWLRDAAFTLHALMGAGFTREAGAWSDWLVRAVAGEPAAVQSVYGVAGERRLTELELPWLPGYEDSRPVRVGNGAISQLQIDVFGEVMDCLHLARRSGLKAEEDAWDVQRALLAQLEAVWREPDEGIWEIRGPRRHFTHSKVMAWVAVDRALRDAQRFRLPCPTSQWSRLRDEIHAEVCRAAWSPERNAFLQSYGSRELDASLLLIPLVGFLPASDPRVRGTIEAIERELVTDGLVRRYRTCSGIDGLSGEEGAFLPCSFWLADCYGLLGRTEEARGLFEHLLSLRNDVGLLSEEYDTSARRLVGNFPQAFSHVALINSAQYLSRGGGSGARAEGRRDEAE
jgi:GH15 family glucan-1,4-alpha-glucosidase